MRSAKGSRPIAISRNATCFLVYDGTELLTPNGVDARAVEAMEKLKPGLRVLGVHEMMR